MRIIIGLMLLKVAGIQSEKSVSFLVMLELLWTEWNRYRFEFTAIPARPCGCET